MALNVTRSAATFFAEDRISNRSTEIGRSSVTARIKFLRDSKGAAFQTFARLAFIEFWKPQIWSSLVTSLKAIDFAVLQHQPGVAKIWTVKALGQKSAQQQRLAE